MAKMRPTRVHLVGPNLPQLWTDIAFAPGDSFSLVRLQNILDWWRTQIYDLQTGCSVCTSIDGRRKWTSTKELSSILLNDPRGKVLDRRVIDSRGICYCLVYCGNG
ncbi:MAG: hypothetical protein M0T78_04995 [Actinomycetota bacterium]|nr:hypothetical protein [Actinomycetota bacterium]